MGLFLSMKKPRRSCNLVSGFIISEALPVLDRNYQVNMHVVIRGAHFKPKPKTYTDNKIL